jgi:hypothetical protein
VGDEDTKRQRAGQTVTDLCRACKAMSAHTVIAVDAGGRVLRVMCDSCGSQHDYRGGGESVSTQRSLPARPGDSGEAPPRVGPRETRGATMPTVEDRENLEQVLRRVLREELGLTSVVPADKWRGGELVLRPGKPALQEKKWPIDSFFNKVVLIRNRLRTLEQQVNASDLPTDEKLKLQSYVTACYGSLTSFNVLFADEADRFHGAGGTDRVE